MRKSAMKKWSPSFVPDTALPGAPVFAWPGLLHDPVFCLTPPLHGPGAAQQDMA
jgi:hypothetical protein